MSWGPICGLWPGERGLVGAVVDLDGVVLEARTIRPSDDDEIDEHDVWFGRVTRFHGPQIEVVVTPRLARGHPACRLALDLGHRVWLAPRSVLELIASVAWWRPTPRNYAIALARMPLSRAARPLLRTLMPDPPRQLRLF